MLDRYTTDGTINYHKLNLFDFLSPVNYGVCQLAKHGENGYGLILRFRLRIKVLSR
jgi:hypothetical protein